MFVFARYIANSCKQNKNKKAKDVLKCKHCDYTTTSRQGLKIHNTKVHSLVDFKEFPAVCDICEKILENEMNLKQHKKTEHISLCKISVQ